MTAPGYDANTILLIHGNTLADKSKKQCSIANIGVTVDTSAAHLTDGSLYFDGSSYLAVSLEEMGLDFNGDWTIEFFHKITSASTNKSAFFCLNQASYGFVIGSPSSGKERMFAGNSSWGFIGVTNIGTKKTDAWVHRAICKQGTTVYAFENGVLYTTIETSGILTPTASELLIGYRTHSSYAGGIVGHMDEIRISNIARYTADFDVPTNAFER